MFDIIFYVVVALSVAVLALQLRTLWYGRMSDYDRASLVGTELRHYTSRATGDVIDQSDGTVTITPRRGFWGWVAEVSHQNWAVLVGSGHAVYFYSGTPTDQERRYHGHANEVVVCVAAADLLARHHGRLYASPLDSAVAVRGGYHGPGRVETTTPVDTTGGTKGVVRGVLHAMRKGR